MDISQIERFLLLIGASNITRDAARGWVRASCPLSPWLHEKGADRKPSFGIKSPEGPGQSPFFHCFTCGTSGPLPRLLHDLTRLSGDRYLEASDFLSQFPVFDEDPDEQRKRPRRIKVTDKYASSVLVEREALHNEPVPAECLEAFPLLAEKCSLTAHAEALKWLAHTRNISLRSIAAFQLRLYVAPVLEDVGVIFPILDRTAERVLDLWVRMIDRKKFFRLSKDYTGSKVDYKAPNLWFGNHLYSTDKPLILVEGALDALRLHSLGVSNVLASFGAPSREQMESIYAPVVYLGYDNDGENGAGARITKKLAETLQVPSLAILDWGVAGVKDAGELASEAQLRLVFDARTKILKSHKTKTERKVKPDPASVILKSKKDGSFL